MVLRASLIVAVILVWAGAGARPVRADCPVGDPTCFELEPDSGPPGTSVSAVAIFPGCEGKTEYAVLVPGTLDPDGDYPQAPITAGGEGIAIFVVPPAPAGKYALEARCGDGPVQDLTKAAHFTVTAGQPATDTEPVPARRFRADHTAGLSLALIAGWLLWRRRLGSQPGPRRG